MNFQKLRELIKLPATGPKRKPGPKERAISKTFREETANFIKEYMALKDIKPEAESSLWHPDVIDVEGTSK